MQAPGPAVVRRAIFWQVRRGTGRPCRRVAGSRVAPPRWRRPGCLALRANLAPFRLRARSRVRAAAAPARWRIWKLRATWYILRYLANQTGLPRKLGSVLTHLQKSYEEKHLVKLRLCLAGTVVSAHGHPANQPSFPKRPLSGSQARGAKLTCVRVCARACLCVCMCARKRVWVWGGGTSQPFYTLMRPNSWLGGDVGGLWSFPFLGEVRPAETSRRPPRTQGAELGETAWDWGTPGIPPSARKEWQSLVPCLILETAGLPGRQDSRTRFSSAVLRPPGPLQLGEGANSVWSPRSASMFAKG